MNNAVARLLVIGAATTTLDALAAHCARADIKAVADLAAALDYLRAQGAVRPRLIVIDAAAGDAAATTGALKADAQTRVIPLAVLAAPGAAELLDACYRAGANACVVKPEAKAALQEVAGALLGFWLGANEWPPAGD